MSQSAPPLAPGTPSGWPRALSLTTRVVVLSALTALLVFIASTGQTIWTEWRQLRGEEGVARAGVAIGYPGIAPDLSFARKPDDWFHDEGDSTVFWGGWRHGEGHQWFRVARGEVDRSRISEPIGRDVIRAIDRPITEHLGGAIWKRIPDEAPVVGSRLAGVDTVYPQLVLNKVLVVNDTIADRPFLVLASPLSARGQWTAVYDPVLDGKRLVMGVAGYFLDREPLVFDRDTESLWVVEGDALRAISGKLKGQSLRQLARPSAVSWLDWRTRHPGSRLVVGADRGKPTAKL